MVGQFDSQFMRDESDYDYPDEVVASEIGSSLSACFLGRRWVVGLAKQPIIPLGTYFPATSAQEKLTHCLPQGALLEVAYEAHLPGARATKQTIPVIQVRTFGLPGARFRATSALSRFQHRCCRVGYVVSAHASGDLQHHYGMCSQSQSIP